MKLVNTLFVVIGTIVMAYVMQRIGLPLKTADTPFGILNLEFAFNSNQASAIRWSWLYAHSENLRLTTIAIRHTWLDFVFIFFYSFFLFSGCLMVSNSFSGKIMEFGKLIAVSSLYAGFFDILENVGILLMLKGFTGGAIPLVTGILSSAKWFLVAVALLYIAVFGIASAFRRKN